MLAVDTNVVVRLLVNDDERQGAVARRLFESDELWIGVMVLLEAAWVLESAYDLSAHDTVAVLIGLLGLPNVRVEDPAAVAAALNAARKGHELADALHLMRAPEGAEFVTFDRGLALVHHAKLMIPSRLLFANADIRTKSRRHRVRKTRTRH